jgi:hypothetical protein
MVPLNESQVRYIYAYDTTELTTCLEAAGIEVDPPETLENFLAEYPHGPAGRVYAHVGSSPLAASLARQCPQTPPHLYD